MITSLQTLAAEVQSRIAAEPEPGDVPGSVLVTVMTAGLVTTLWIVADDQLRQIFSSALGRVTGP